MNYSKTTRNLSILFFFLFSLAQAEEPASPVLKTIAFHGVRATDPDGRMGLRNPERGLRYESRIGNSIGKDNNRMDWIRAMQRFEPDGMTLSQAYCYLDAFVDKPISQEKLDWLQRDFALMRKYGFKCLLRFQRSFAMTRAKGWELDLGLSYLFDLQISLKVAQYSGIHNLIAWLVMKRNYIC